MKRLVRRATVDRDIVEIAAYIAKDRPSSAARFIDAVEETFRTLAERGPLGQLYVFQEHPLEPVRLWQVHGFRHYIIVYREMDDGLDVLRVVHAARDLEALLQAL